MLGSKLYYGTDFWLHASSVINERHNVFINSTTDVCKCSVPELALTNLLLNLMIIFCIGTILHLTGSSLS